MTQELSSQQSGERQPEIGAGVSHAVATLGFLIGKDVSMETFSGSVFEILKTLRVTSVTTENGEVYLHLTKNEPARPESAKLASQSSSRPGYDEAARLIKVPLSDVHEIWAGETAAPWVMAAGTAETHPGESGKILNDLYGKSIKLMPVDVCDRRVIGTLRVGESALIIVETKEIFSGTPTYDVLNLGSLKVYRKISVTI
jgi:hypothetical protein